MERRIRFSDISGVQIEDGQGARVRIMFFDRRKPDRRLDVTSEEAEQLGGEVVHTRPARRRRAAAQAAMPALGADGGEVGSGTSEPL